jgi:hypothetical protein
MPQADALSIPLPSRAGSLPWQPQHARADAFLMEARAEGADIAAGRAPLYEQSQLINGKLMKTADKARRREGERRWAIS